MIGWKNSHGFITLAHFHFEMNRINRRLNLVRKLLAKDNSRIKALKKRIRNLKKARKR